MYTGHVLITGNQSKVFATCTQVMFSLQVTQQGVCHLYTGHVLTSGNHSEVFATCTQVLSLLQLTFLTATHNELTIIIYLKKTLLTVGL